jgi:spoIIIJ-associated protein
MEEQRQEGNGRGDDGLAPQKSGDQTGAPAQPAPGGEKEMVRDVVQTLLDHIGLRGRAEVNETEGGFAVNIRSRQSSGLLIGRHGATLKAIQHLTRLIVTKHYPAVTNITVDVAGYNQRREHFIIAKAQAVARIVRETGREMLLDELTEKETAVVREALADQPDVRVHTVGIGSRRNVIIGPAG